MANDTFEMKEENDFFYRIQTKYIKRTGITVDIGANPSAEGVDGDEGSDDLNGGDVVNDFIEACRLQETSFDKKSYMIYIKDYVKKLKEKITERDPARAAVFTELAKVEIPKIINNFSEFRFFTGESGDPEGMVVLMGYEDDTKPPYALVFKDGCREEKV